MATSKISIETVERFLREQLENGENISVTIHLKNHNKAGCPWFPAAGSESAESCGSIKTTVGQ